MIFDYVFALIAFASKFLAPFAASRVSPLLLFLSGMSCQAEGGDKSL